MINLHYLSFDQQIDPKDQQCTGRRQQQSETETGRSSRHERHAASCVSFVVHGVYQIEESERSKKLWGYWKTKFSR